MFGDILTDEASVLCGSIGLCASASLGSSSFGLYEPIHGSAPSIAGKNIANPISAILCVSQMMRYTFGAEHVAKDIEKAVSDVLTQGFRTKDLMGKGDNPANMLGTIAMGDKIVEQFLK
jgi:3-isopropylmalate dehydrogenase